MGEESNPTERGNFKEESEGPQEDRRELGMKWVLGVVLYGRLTKSWLACVQKQLLSGKQEPVFSLPQGSMQDALFRPATVLLDDRMSPGMRQGAGLL